jgi:hypothetical protein
VNEKLPARVIEQAHADSATRERPLFPRMGMPRKIAVNGMQGVDATIVVTVAHGTVWLSISPPFTWQAIMEPRKVDEVIHVLELARDEAIKITAAWTTKPRRR